MKKFIVLNNSCLDYKYYVEIEFETGKVFYKSNVTDFNTDYECFFIIPIERMLQFLDRDDFIYNWQSTYSNESAISLDGSRWSVKIIDYAEKEIAGINCKPKEFDCFINELELLIKKDFGGQYT